MALGASVRSRRAAAGSVGSARLQWFWCGAKSADSLGQVPAREAMTATLDTLVYGLTLPCGVMLFASLYLTAAALVGIGWEVWAAVRSRT